MPEETYCQKVIEEFSEKFSALLDEASLAGVKTLVVCAVQDELNQELDMRIMHSGGYVFVSGMANYAKIVMNRSLHNYCDSLFEDQ